MLAKPDVVRAIHDANLAVGADIIETSTFGATAVAQEDYGLGDLARGTVRQAKPIENSLNCVLGAAPMRPYIAEFAKVASDTFISCYPNAGLPNPMAETGFDETPEVTGRMLEEFAAAGFVNIVGGCCGTTPEHIAEIARRVSAYRPRGVADPLFRELLAA